MWTSEDIRNQRILLVDTKASSAADCRKSRWSSLQTHTTFDANLTYITILKLGSEEKLKLEKVARMALMFWCIQWRKMQRLLLSQLNPNLSQLKPNLSQLNPNLSQLNPNLSQLNPNMSQLNPNLSQLYPNLSHLYPKLSQLYPK